MWANLGSCGLVLCDQGRKWREMQLEMVRRHLYVIPRQYHAEGQGATLRILIRECHDGISVSDRSFFLIGGLMNISRKLVKWMR
jgi:hypothetical protein